MRRIVLLVAVGAVVAATMMLAGPVLAKQGGRTLSAVLTGAEEVPGPGNPDGGGSAVVTVNRGLARVCYELSVSGIAPATAAHIHEAPAGQAGPVVVGLTPPKGGSSSGCAQVGRALAKDIRKNPSGYYVNVHNAEFPAGALRGQLSK